MASITGTSIVFNDGGSMAAVGYAPSFVSRAWCRINSSSGTPVIQGSGNVSSVSDMGVGLNQFNFSTAMPDANFTTVGNSSRAINAISSETITNPYGFNVSYTSTRTQNKGAGTHDAPVIDIVVVR